MTAEGDWVRLVLTHRRLSNRSSMLSVGAGWHTHLAVLIDRLNARTSPAFWTLYGGLEEYYEKAREGLTGAIAPLISAEDRLGLFSRGVPNESSRSGIREADFWRLVGVKQRRSEAIVSVGGSLEAVA